MQHIDDEEVETEILEYDPHDLNSMARHIRKQRDKIFALSVLCSLLVFLLIIALVARINGVYCL